MKTKNIYKIATEKIEKIKQYLQNYQTTNAKKAIINKLGNKAKRRLKLVQLAKKIGIKTPKVLFLKEIRLLMALRPLDLTVQSEGKELLQLLNAREIKKLEEHIKEEETIIVIIGCNKKRIKLKEAMDSLNMNDNRLKVIGVVAKNINDWQVEFDKKQGILKVPCKDSYEGLTEKVTWTCLAFSLCRKTPNIFKVDDDCVAIEKERIKKLVEETKAKNSIAAGSPISVNNCLSIDRSWHLGKSQGKANHQPFQGISAETWMSGGAGYLLTDEGVNTIGGFCLHSWGYIEQQIYEDMTITYLIQRLSKNIYWTIDYKKLGTKNERIYELSNGLKFHDKKLLDQGSEE